MSKPPFSAAQHSHLGGGGEGSGGGGLGLGGGEGGGEGGGGLGLRSRHSRKQATVSRQQGIPQAQMEPLLHMHTAWQQRSTVKHSAAQRGTQRAARTWAAAARVRAVEGWGLAAVARAAGGWGCEHKKISGADLAC